MGVSTGATGPNFQLPWARAATGRTAATDYNRAAHVLEHVCRSVLQMVFEQGVVLADPERCQFDDTTLRIAPPDGSSPIVGLVGGRPFYMTNDMEEDGVATAGSTTYVRDSSLDAADDAFWPAGGYIVFTSGSNDGLVRAIQSYNSTTKQVNWETVLPVAVEVGDTFTLTHFYVQGLTNGALNYIYIREGGDTQQNYYGMVRFVATTNAVAADTDILIATVTLDGGGTVTAYSNSPSGAARRLLPGVGRQDTEVQTYEWGPLDPDEVTAPITIDHETYTHVPGRVVELTDDLGDPITDCTVVLTEMWQANRCILTISNDGDYVRQGTLTATITGRQSQTL
jgi:hypothetical protein